eukprot:13936909-Alexandrium_andersonii.AAC.1
MPCLLYASVPTKPQGTPTKKSLDDPRGPSNRLGTVAQEPGGRGLQRGSRTVDGPELLPVVDVGVAAEELNEGLGKQAVDD